MIQWMGKLTHFRDTIVIYTEIFNLAKFLELTYI